MLGFVHPLAGGRGRSGSILSVCRCSDRLKLEKGMIQRGITSWLDEEYIPQDIHSKLGSRAAELYAEMKEANEDADVGDVILKIGSELMDYDMKEAFVGPYDVANRVGSILLELQSDESG